MVLVAVALLAVFVAGSGSGRKVSSVVGLPVLVVVELPSNTFRSTLKWFAPFCRYFTASDSPG